MASVVAVPVEPTSQNRKYLRRAGLPVSSSAIESRIKAINYRVKGTEKFWNRPDGAEHILRVRDATLSGDDKLSAWIPNRPGSYFHRASAEKHHSTAVAAAKQLGKCPSGPS